MFLLTGTFDARYWGEMEIPDTYDEIREIVEFASAREVNERLHAGRKLLKITERQVGDANRFPTYIMGRPATVHPSRHLSPPE